MIMYGLFKLIDNKKNPIHKRIGFNTLLKVSN